MESVITCPECGAAQSEGKSCQDDFYQMLYWEAEKPALGVVHHLMVLSYHLQHPILYSPDGLTYSMGLLVDFVERGITPDQSRQDSRPKVDSGKREWKVTARPGSHGAYEHPVTWTKTAADVVAAGMEHYIDSVRAWAKSLHESLAVSDNLPVG
jgi:hypothetical protein